MNKSQAKIIFMGTPDIARDCLEQMIDDGYNISAVFTREDKPVGRKMVMTAPPVKQVAEKHGITVYQPKTLKGDAGDIIREIAPDLIVVVAYGRLLPKNIIDMPHYGCVNLHVSLLPKYRGAAPIQWSVINGDKQTGVTVMYINEGLDTGDIIDVLPVEIGEDETREELFDDVAAKGKVFLSKVCEDVLAGNINPVPQDDSLASYAPPLTKEMALFTFEEDSRTLHNKIRGMYSWPCAFFMYGGKKVKVLKSKQTDEKGEPGEVLSLKPLTVAAKNGAIQLLQVGPEGSKPMEGTAWAMGRRFKKGDILK